MTSILDFYKEVRSYSEELCSPLNIEDYIPQPEEFVSPPKWHLAHTTWFFEEFILKVHLAGYELFHNKYSFLFNSYYNHVGLRTGRAKRGDMTRPTVEEVYNYRHYVDEHIIKLIKEKGNDEIDRLIILGLNHEQQHQELLITDLKYTLSLNPLHPVYNEESSLVDDIIGQPDFVRIEAGNYFIGVKEGKEGFYYDNEYNQHKVYLNEYSISNTLVSNEEFLEFVESGEYLNFKHWHDEGFAWVNENKAMHPMYWLKLDDVWNQYTLEGLKPLNPNATLAHINFYEASAFASWKGTRLPTEQEWEVASGQFEWGRRWEWTQSAYLPYPGFNIAEGAIGEYNGKFMINQKVLRGGSNATSPGHSRNTYRNFFHPQHRWQLTGIRLVK